MAGIKEMVIISGKGGTGKTSLTASLACLFKNKVVADCDVDAANLHLILKPEKVLRETGFTGGSKASIDPDKCISCGMCTQMCRFDAISDDFTVDPFSCEGCGACHYICPANAVDFTPRVVGHQYICDTARGDRFAFAELLPGEDNSGKLVAAVRNDARQEAETAGVPLVLIDGPPGIGCPVISSVTGTHLIVIVTEPTPTGIHDLERVVALANHFRIPAAVVVNKCDINPAQLQKIKDYCAAVNHSFIGEIPYEPAITEAQKAGRSILEESPDSAASVAIKDIHGKLQSLLEAI